MYTVYPSPAVEAALARLRKGFSMVPGLESSPDTETYKPSPAKGTGEQPAIKNKNAEDKIGMTRLFIIESFIRQVSSGIPDDRGHKSPDWRAKTDFPENYTPYLTLNCPGIRNKFWII
jgi:hypothetical protein